MKAIVLNDTSFEHHHGCELVMGNLRAGLEKQGIEVSLALSLHDDWRRSAAFREQMGDCQLVVVNGEGTIHSNRPRGIALLEVGAFAQKRGVPAALVNASYEGNNPLVCGPLLSEFSLVSFRDRLSQHEAGGLVGASRVVPDLSFATEGCAHAGTRRGYGFTDSVRADVTDFLWRIFANDPRFRPIPVLKPEASPCGEIVNRLRTRYSARKLWAVSEVASQVRSAMRSRRGRISDTKQFLDALSGLEGLVSGRYHSVCLSILSETPFVALASNTSKIDALLRDCGLSASRAVSDSCLLSGEWIDRIPFTDLEKIKIREFVAAAKLTIGGLFSDLRTLAEKGVEA